MLKNNFILRNFWHLVQLCMFMWAAQKLITFSKKVTR